MNVKVIICCFLLLPLSLTISAKSSPATDTVAVMKMLKAKCRELLLSDTPYATEQSYRLTDDITYSTDAEGYYQQLLPEGKWADIDYNSQMRNAWKPSWHLYRIMLLCRKYKENQSRDYLLAIHKSMSFWILHDFKCENWWQNNINVPFAYSSIILMLGQDVTEPEVSFLNKVIKNRIPVYKATGQNLIWQLDNEARLALIHGNYQALKGVFKRMQAVITVTTAEGIQPDYSFQQHGAMLQFGNYGMHFLNSLLFWIDISEGSSLAFQQEKKDILYRYFSEGLRWTVFAKDMDLTAVGRQLKEDCGRKRGENLFVNAETIRSLDEGNKCSYKLDGFGHSDVDPCHFYSNKSFWRSNYMVQFKTGEYMMSVKMHGSLVKRIEAINGENLKGAFLNDGVTLIQRTGREYKNIAPLWNWSMLPGITVDTSWNPSQKPAISTANSAYFVGQVSDGENGIATMDYQRAGLKAKKTYFFAAGSLIALGAGISAADMTNIATTVDQRLVRENENIQLSRTKSKEIGHVWLDSTGYFFPKKGTDVVVSLTERKGNWKNIDLASGDKEVAGKIFTASIPHRKRANYIYAIRPGISKEKANYLAERPEFKVIKNDSTLQAIETNNLIMAVFHEAGKVSISKNRLETNEPCLIIYHKKDRRFYLADPGEDLSMVKISVNGQMKVISLPTGDSAGNTIEIR